VTLVYPGRD